MGFARIGAGHRDHPSTNRDNVALIGEGGIGREQEGPTRAGASGRDETSISGLHEASTLGSVELGVRHQGTGTRQLKGIG